METRSEDRQIDGETYLAHSQVATGPVDAIEYAWRGANIGIPFPHQLSLPVREPKLRMSRSSGGRGSRKGPTHWTEQMDARLDVGYAKARQNGTLPQLAAALGVTMPVMTHRARGRHLTLVRNQSRAGSKRAQIFARLGNGIVPYGELRALAREFGVPEKRVRSYASQLRMNLKRATAPGCNRLAHTGT